MKPKLWKTISFKLFVGITLLLIFFVAYLLDIPRLLTTSYHELTASVSYTIVNRTDESLENIAVYTVGDTDSEQHPLLRIESIEADSSVSGTIGRATVAPYFEVTLQQEKVADSREVPSFLSPQHFSLILEKDASSGKIIGRYVPYTLEFFGE